MKAKKIRFEWDGVAPGYPYGGYCAIDSTYCLTFEALKNDTEGRVVWYIDRALDRGSRYDFEKVIMDFAPDIHSAMRAAEAAFLRLQKPRLELVA